jgi:hypothetical protein
MPPGLAEARGSVSGDTMIRKGPGGKSPRAAIAHGGFKLAARGVSAHHRPRNLGLTTD